MFSQANGRPSGCNPLGGSSNLSENFGVLQVIIFAEMAESGLMHFPAKEATATGGPEVRILLSALIRQKRIEMGHKGADAL